MGPGFFSEIEFSSPHFIWNRNLCWC